MAEEGIAKTLSFTGTFYQASNVCHVQEGRYLTSELSHYQWSQKHNIKSLDEQMQVSPCWQACGAQPTNPTSHQEQPP